ncbi:MAG TPA: hypothetical protein VGO06_01010 [Bosea sp. (in: a-proteobacteria)]|uniref:hypothetical protein n=1 Tax=Bosea sp. (in: a-proteobacteria) TaxID=1871050 RepID=UPI002E138FCA|nr:hypothetical protein [Bosea sp. (in: a-proteobacteria)]
MQAAPANPAIQRNDYRSILSFFLADAVRSMKGDFKDLALRRRKRLPSAVPVAEFRCALAAPVRTGRKALASERDGLSPAMPCRPGEGAFKQNAANEPFFLASLGRAKTFFGLVALIKKNIRLT